MAANHILRLGMGWFWEHLRDLASRWRNLAVGLLAIVGLLATLRRAVPSPWLFVVGALVLLVIAQGMVAFSKRYVCGHVASQPVKLWLQATMAFANVTCEIKAPDNSIAIGPSTQHGHYDDYRYPTRTLSYPWDFTSFHDAMSLPDGEYEVKWKDSQGRVIATDSFVITNRQMVR